MRRKIEREIDMFATHPVVEKIGKMNWTGNVIPTNWFRNITFANGKPHFVAITILAEIVYWYRPSIVRDENTGQIVEKKKFKDDMLQRSYQSFADQFGFSKRQAKEAIDYLVQRQLIRREFRNVRSFTGTILNNVMFVEPIPENLKNVTYEEKEMDVTFSCVKKEEATFSPSSSVQKEETDTAESQNQRVQREEATTFERKTNTKIKKDYIKNNKLHHDDGAQDPKDPIAFFEENGFGTVGTYIKEKISKWCRILSEQQVVHAMKRAVEYDVKNWAYVEAILRNLVHQKHKQDVCFKEKHTKKVRNIIRKEPVPDWLNSNQKTWHEPVELEEDIEKMKRELEQRLRKYGYRKTKSLA